jgi:hypothetical protein
MAGKRKATVSLEQLSAGFSYEELSVCIKVPHVPDTPQAVSQCVSICTGRCATLPAPRATS